MIVFTPGEAAAAGYTGYLTPRTLTGAMAEALHGAVIMIERKVAHLELEVVFDQYSPTTQTATGATRVHAKTRQQRVYSISRFNNPLVTLSISRDQLQYHLMPPILLMRITRYVHGRVSRLHGLPLTLSQPWIWVGGSYSGALPAFIEKVSKLGLRAEAN